MADKTKTKFTFKKILLLGSSILLFSAVISSVVTAKFGENRAAYFLQNLFTERGTVEQGMPPIDGLDPIEDIPEGEIRYNINKEVYFPNGYAMGDVLLHNPESSKYALKLNVYLADGSSNMPVYTSPLLQPGTYISGDKLSRYLNAGTYPCTYSIAAYDPQDTETQTGSASGFVTIVVVC